MSDFKAKMYQNRFRLGLRPRPRWGSLQRSPDPLAGLKGAYFEWKGRGYGKGGKGRKGKEGQGREGGEGEGRRGEGMGREGTPIFYCNPQFQFSRNMPDSVTQLDSL